MMKFLVGVSVLSALFLLNFTGSNADTDSNIVSMVKELKFELDQQAQRLKFLATELMDTKKRVSVLEKQMKICTCSKPDPLLPNNTKDLKQPLDKLLPETESPTRHRRSSDTDSLPSQQLSGISTLIAQALTQVVQEQLRQTLRCNDTDQLGGECSIRPGPKGGKGDEGRRGVKGDQGDQDPPGIQGSCVVCYIATRSVMFVQQASYLCPSGWSREYYGYMISGATIFDRQRTTTICVDANAEAVPGTGADTNPSFALLHSVECTNSELPCSPYVDGRILSCALCTK